MARESAKRRGERAAEIVRRLAEAYPGSAEDLCALRHDGPFELLVATILSAQCTDERVNMVTPTLFSRYPTPHDLASASPDDLEEMIRSTGFFRSKAKHLLGMAKAVEERFGGRLPLAMEDLVSLPGVGRKTANVVRSVAGGLPGLPVDTHVLRLSRRLRLTAATDPVRVEADLCRLVPEQEWGALSLRLILHGRAVCTARRPLCGRCVLADLCPSAGIGDLPAKTPGRPLSAAEGGKGATTRAGVATASGVRPGPTKRTSSEPVPPASSQEGQGRAIVTNRNRFPPPGSTERGSGSAARPAPRRRPSGRRRRVVRLAGDDGAHGRGRQPAWRARQVLGHYPERCRMRARRRWAPSRARSTAKRSVAAESSPSSSAASAMRDTRRVKVSKLAAREESSE